MRGYVAVAFLESSMIRMDHPGLAEGPTVPLSPPDAARIEDVRVVRSMSSDEIRERGLALRERRAALRRAWEHTTFYLFDAESWR